MLGVILWYWMLHWISELKDYSKDTPVGFSLRTYTCSQTLNVTGHCCKMFHDALIMSFPSCLWLTFPPSLLHSLSSCGTGNWRLFKDTAALAGTRPCGCEWTPLMKGVWHWAGCVLPQHWSLMHLKKNPGTKPLLYMYLLEVMDVNIKQWSSELKHTNDCKVLDNLIS